MRENVKIGVFDSGIGGVTILREILKILPNEDYIYYSDSKNNPYGDKTDEEIIDILKMVDIYDLIEKLPNKLDSMLMENANNLSGGQRQKLAIAQALISKPKILIFDESTSNLDSMSESIIKKIISSLKDMTVIVVTHRLNLIKNCNEIFVLEGGTITEHGTHDLLLNQGHTYYRLWMEQQ